jgi:hypothetical protein
MKTIFSICQNIMEKPNWQEKYTNPEIWEKWQVEIEEQLAPKDPEHHLKWLHTGRMPMLDDGDEISRPGWDYLKLLLDWQASRVEGPVMPAAVEGAWVADKLIGEELKNRLFKAVAPFENVSDGEKDWHPGSNEQVLDLVHPSLFCLVYGVSRQLQDGQITMPALKSMGGGDIVFSSAGVNPPERKRRRREEFYYDGDPPPKDYDTSMKYQWLPSEFDISPEGKVKISSYVNNIHPIKHKDMYFVLEDVFEHFVPMFNKVLNDLVAWRPETFTSLGTENVWEIPPGENFSQWGEEIIPEDVNVDEEDIEDSDVMDQDEDVLAAELQGELVELAEEMQVEPQYAPPDVQIEAVPMDISSSGSPSEEEAAESAGSSQQSGEPYQFLPPLSDNSIDIRGHKVQVIVKLANIILTPENPRYKGGSWHVEGMKNEAIVATGIYYYESENISESRLAFRKVIHDPASGGYDEDGSEVARLNRVYGMDNMDSLNESRGSVLTQEDRLICFPNILQHQVQPFELADPTKPGHRKILVFFLIDPSKRIISTETVPPQQRHWYGEALKRHVPEIARLPQEMLDLIISNVSGCPMSLEEAKEHRKGLMEERKYFVDEYEQHVYERTISLCEH